MPKPFKEWTVLPHGKLTRLEDNLLSVEGELHMPLGDFPRRMTVVRLDDGRLVIYSAIALDEDEMQALEAYGTPAFLVVPNNLHRLDAKIWRDRYPAMKVLAPVGVREKVQEVVPVDATKVTFADPDVRFVPSRAPTIVKWRSSCTRPAVPRWWSTTSSGTSTIARASAAGCSRCSGSPAMSRASPPSSSSGPSKTKTRYARSSRRGRGFPI